MLSIIFGEQGLDWPNRISQPSTYFDEYYETSWLSTDFAKRVIKEIDNSEYVSGHCIESPILGMIPPKMLSSGCKTLILLENMDVIVSGERIGDNCFPILLELCKTKDRVITLCHTVLFNEPFEVKDFCTGKVISTNLELMETMIDS